MSSDPTNQLLNYFKQLVKQLDTKFSDLEKQLDKIEANMDNLRTFNERFQNQISNEINELRQSLLASNSLESKIFNGSPEIEPQPQIPISNYKPIPKSEPRFSAPPGPPPLDQFKSSQSTIQPGFVDLSSPVPPKEPVPVEISLQKQSNQIKSQYGGLKETPILEALKEERLGDETYFEAQTKKKKVQKQTLQAYLEKLEKIIKKSMVSAQENIKNEDYAGFIDKGLTVVHGIIEFLFVGYRHEFPESSVDYYTKAKNLSGQGLFKDVSLLEKLETIFGQIERDEKPVLARPLLRGFNERITKLYEDFDSKLLDAFARL